jgi:hypothetical protein
MNAGPLLQTVAEELSGRIGGGNCGSEKATIRASRKESTSDLRCRNGARRWSRNLGKPHNLDPYSDPLPRQISFCLGGYHSAPDEPAGLVLEPSTECVLNGSPPQPRFVGFIKRTSRPTIVFFPAPTMYPGARCPNYDTHVAF